MAKLKLLSKRTRNFEKLYQSRAPPKDFDLGERDIFAFASDILSNVQCCSTTIFVSIEEFCKIHFVEADAISMQYNSNGFP
jgi:hypothetical protein